MAPRSRDLLGSGPLDDDMLLDLGMSNGTSQNNSGRSPAQLATRPRAQEALI